MLSTIRVMFVHGLLAVSAISACGVDETPPTTTDLSQDFYGRWKGDAVLKSAVGEHVVSLSVGVSINGTRGWVNDLCPSFADANLTGGGHGAALTATGNVVCPPAPFGSCPRATVIWTSAEVTLTSATTSHLVAVGMVKDCDEMTSFTAYADLQRVSH